MNKKSAPGIEKIEKTKEDNADNDAATTQPHSAEVQVRSESIVQSANLFLVARRILATSLGAIALSMDETNEFIARLMERGEVAEHEIGALVDEMRTQIGSRGKELVQRYNALPADADKAESESPSDAALPGESANSGNGHLPAGPHTADRLPTARAAALSDRVESVLGRLNVPTRSDIESITRKIELLSNKVLLLKSKSGQARDGAPESNGNTPVSVHTQEDA